MARPIVEPVQVTHPDHGDAVVPKHKVEALKASGWKLKTKPKKVSESEDG